MNGCARMSDNQADWPSSASGGLAWLGPNGLERSKRLPRRRSRRLERMRRSPLSLVVSASEERSLSRLLLARYGIEEGTLVVAEPREGGVLIRTAVVLPVEVYTPERKARFLLSNAVNAADYARAMRAVQAMGLDPMRDSAL